MSEQHRTGGRARFVDVYRGLLMAHMALDHASLMLNAERGGEELATAAPAPPADFLNFLTRFSGVPVAPGFAFMAGYMVATTSLAREARGVPAREVTRRLLLRGAVLVIADAVVLGLPRALSGFYSFMVLSCIGVSIALLAAVRHQPSRLLLVAAVAVLALHQLLDVSAWPVPLRAVVYEPVRTGAVRSLYPLVPWCAVVLVGFVVGRDAATRPRPARLWALLALGCLLVFTSVRLNAGYGNAYAYTGVLSYEFWSFAKYPPDLAFLSWSLCIIFVSLALIFQLTRSRTPAPLRPFAVYGRVPFFFYLTHFYLLGAIAGVIGAVVQHKLTLPGTYVVWLVLLLLMAWPCSRYYRKKVERPSFITRYL